MAQGDVAAGPAVTPVKGAAKEVNDLAGRLELLSRQEKELTRERKRLMAKIAKAEERIELSDCVLNQAVDARAGLARWLQHVESSAIGGLARRIHEQYKGRDSQAKGAYERAVSSPDVDFEEPRRARNAFVRSFTRRLLFSVVALVLAALYLDDLARWSAQYFQNEATNLALFWALLGIFVLSSLFLALWKHFQRHNRYRRTVQLAQHAISEAEREFIQSRMISTRMDVMRPQLAEWTLIMAHVAHRPWIIDPEWTTGTARSLSHALPNCVEVAVPDASDAMTQRSIDAVIRNSLAEVGWRTRSYDQLLRGLAMEEPTGDPEDDPVGVMKDRIDADSTSERTGDRSLFLKRLAEEESTIRAGQSRAAMLDAAQALLSSELMRTHTVRPLIGDIAAERKGLLDPTGVIEQQRPPWVEFLSDIADERSSVSAEAFTDHARTSAGVPEFHTILWFPDAKGQPVLRTVGTETVAIEGETGRPLLRTAEATTNRGVDTTLRIDIGTAVSPEALRMFEAVASSEPMTANDEGEDDDRVY